MFFVDGSRTKLGTYQGQKLLTLQVLNSLNCNGPVIMAEGFIVSILRNTCVISQIHQY